MNPTTPTDVLAWLLTGVFLLLYGVRQISDALQRVIRGRMQEALIRMSKFPLAPFGIGLIVTALIQSSSAVATLLVELVSTGLLPLSTAIVMVLGANVGSTLVVQLMALHITDHALVVFGGGTLVALCTYRIPVFRRFGRVLFAFTVILLGLAAIGIAGQAIAHNEATKAVLLVLEGDNAQLILILIGTLLAIILNSSTATIGLVLTLAGSGALKPVPALVLMLGANVGTTLLSMLAALGQKTVEGRRLATVHTGTKLLGAVILLLLINPLVTLLNQIWPNDPATQVALTHIGFNVALALLFIPFAGPLATLMERLLPDRSQEAGASSTRLLDPQTRALPELAQGLATRETLRMVDIVTQMFELSIQAFEGRPHTIHKRINALDDQLDNLDSAIRNYLTQLDEQNMTNEQARQDIILLTIVDDLEAIGDVIKQRFMNLADRRFRGQFQFSEGGQRDLQQYHRLIADTLQQVMAAFTANKTVLIAKVLSHRAELKQTKHNLRLRHISELRADVPHSKASSAVFLDLLDAMNAILTHTFNIAYALQGRSSQAFTGQFRSLRSSSFVELNLINTQPLQQAMNLVDTPQLKTTMNLVNTQQVQATMNGTNTQQFYTPPQLDSTQLSEW